MQRITKWSDIAGGLGEEQTTLECGHQDVREMLGVGITSQVATLAHGEQASAELFLPSIEPLDDLPASQPAGGSSAIVEPAGVDHHGWLNPITSKAVAPKMDTGVHQNR